MKQREIKFRAKRIDNGEWVYGHFFEAPEGLRRGYNIVVDASIKYLIDEKTLGQFTGLKDTKGQEIFENDIVKGIMGAGAGLQEKRGKECIFEVKIYLSGSGYGFFMEQITKLTGDYRGFPALKNCEVIGNIYSNPELI